MKAAHRSAMKNRFSLRFMLLLTGAMLIFAACQAAAQPIIPTPKPTATATFTPSATRTPDRNSTPTAPPTRQILPATGGPSPTALLGATRTSLPDAPPTARSLNPNAPRIDFFSSDVLAVEPGGSVTLFWSVRGVDSAAIYRLNREGQRAQVWNVAPDSQLEVRIGSRERGTVDFLLTAGEGNLYTEMLMTLPIACPISWFFSPPPEDCPDEEAQQSNINEQPFERGRMIFIEELNRIYVLFNDGREPAWLSFENRYDPAVHPESDPNYPEGTGFYQPLRELGLVWRGNDTVRNRMGLGLQEAVSFLGFVQSVNRGGNTPHLYLSSTNNTVIEVIPGGDLWQILTPQ